MRSFLSTNFSVLSTRLPPRSPAHLSILSHVVSPHLSSLTPPPPFLADHRTGTAHINCTMTLSNRGSVAISGVAAVHMQDDHGVIYDAVPAEIPAGGQISVRTSLLPPPLPLPLPNLFNATMIVCAGQLQ